MKHSILACGLVGLLAAATSVEALPVVVGSFYVTDDAALGGSVVVENLSSVPGLPGDFGEITIALLLAGGATSEIYGYGTIGPLGPSFVLDGPSNPLFLFAPLTFAPGFNTAALDVPDLSLYLAAALTLTVQTAFVDNTSPLVPQDGAFAPIEIGTASVPEPSIVVLLGTGIAMAVRRRRHSRAASTPPA